MRLSLDYLGSATIGIGWVRALVNETCPFLPLNVRLVNRRLACLLTRWKFLIVIWLPAALDNARTVLYVRVVAMTVGCFVVGLLGTMLPSPPSSLILGLAPIVMFPAMALIALSRGFSVDTPVLTVAQLCLAMTNPGVAIFGTRLILLAP